jgi:hypothetical protein
VLELPQNVPDKGQLQLLLFADAVRTHEIYGFIAVLPERRFPLDPGQDTTICGKPVHLKMRIDQYLALLTEVFYRVGLDVGMCVLQVVNVSLLIRTPLLFENLDVLVGFPFVRAEQQEVGFPRTLGISDNDFRCDGKFHVTPPSLLLRDGRLCMFDAAMGWG